MAILMVNMVSKVFRSWFSRSWLALTICISAYMKKFFSFNILDTKDMEESASKKGRECMSPWPTP